MRHKLLLTIGLLLLSHTLLAQEVLPWNDDLQLELNDFQSPSTQIGGTKVYSVFTAANLKFELLMSQAAFMFTKNFNSKVENSFNPQASAIVAPDSLIAQDLVAFARYTFDLTELQARQLRKKLHEEKRTFSDPNFFKQHYEALQNSISQRHALAAKETDLGRNRDKLIQLHQEVLAEIDQHKDYCHACKPPKRKK